MRAVAVVTLLGLAFVLTVISNIGLWVDRTIYDTDTFVSTTDNVLDDEDVQVVLADRFSEELYVAADVDERLATELPEGLKFLALPLGTAAQNFLNDAALRLLERQPLEDTRNEALRQMHSRLIATIEGDDTGVSAEGDTLVLDLRPVIERVAADVTGRDVNLPQEGGADAPQIPQDVLDRLPADVRARLEQGQDGGLLSRTQLSDDAGRFVIDDAVAAWTYRVARYGNDAVYVAIGVTALAYLLAVAVARHRRTTLRNAGIVLAGAGVLSLALLLPLDYAARSAAENKDAASSVVSVLTDGFKQQSLALIGGGVLVAGLAVLFGDSSLAVAIRASAQRRPDAPPLQRVLRERAGVLRVAGLLAAAIVLIIFPEPTTRAYVTTFGLLAAYFTALYIATSDSTTAVRTRDRLQEIVTTDDAALTNEQAGSLRGWVAAHAGWLRAVGVAVAVALVVFWPDLSLRFVVMVAALALIYLAAIEMALSSTKSAAHTT